MDILKDISGLLSYFVPGFLARLIFFRLTRYEKGSGEYSDVVPAIVISYLCTLFTKWIMPGAGAEVAALVATGVAVAGAILLALLLRWSWFQKKFEQWTHTTVHHSIWDDVLGDKIAKQIRFSTEFNHKKARIEGVVKYYEVKDGECLIALTGYSVTYAEPSLDQKIETDGEENEDNPVYTAMGNAVLMIRADDIGCIEVFEPKLAEG